MNVLLLTIPIFLAIIVGAIIAIAIVRQIMIMMGGYLCRKEDKEIEDLMREQNCFTKQSYDLTKQPTGNAGGHKGNYK